jgi:phage repressor protein C with HTH and peptisase S24 domain
MNLNERISYALRNSGLSQKDVAARVGVSPGALTQWKKGDIQSLRADNLLALAKVTKVNAEWLASGGGEPTASAGQAFGSVPSANGIGSPVATWGGDQPQGESVVYLPEIELVVEQGAAVAWRLTSSGPMHAFAQKWIERHGVAQGTSAALEMSDSGMEPRLQAGDTVVIDVGRSGMITDGRIYAVLLNGEVFIRRIFKELGGGLRIVCDNPDKARYPDRLVPADLMGHLKVIGLAIAVSGGLY